METVPRNLVYFRLYRKDTWLSYMKIQDDTKPIEFLSVFTIQNLIVPNWFDKQYMTRNQYADEPQESVKPTLCQTSVDVHFNVP